MKSAKSASKNNMVASREKILAGWLIDGSGRPPEKDMVLTMQAYIEYMPSEAGRQSRLQNGKGALSPVEGAQRNLAHQLEQMALARQLGVRVAAGTDAGSPGVDHGKSLRAEIGLLIRAGYSIPEAMKSATRINAQLLGLKSIGCLAVGDAASFVAVAGPPEDIPHSLGKIKGFFINGKQFA